MKIINTLVDSPPPAVAPAAKRPELEVVAHSPDTTQYHTPEELVKHGLAEGAATMIPSANEDGSSPGSVPGTPGPVTVVNLDGPVSSEVAKKFASVGLAPAPDPEKEQPPQTSSELTALAGAIQQLLAASDKPVEPSTSTQVIASTPEEISITGNSFESLGIPCIVGPTAQRPAQAVIFDLGPAGMVQTRQHAVIFNDGLTILVYDTRFEDGFQYMPPDQSRTGGEPIRLVFPGMGVSEKRVLSLGIQFSLGVLELIILPDFKEHTHDDQERRNRQPDTGRTGIDEVPGQGSFV